MNKGDKVKLDQSILEDETRKQSDSLFKRIIDEDYTGEVIERGQEKYHKGWWVKFYYGKVLVEENQMVS